MELKLESKKSLMLCAKVCYILSAEFSNFSITPEKLMYNDNYYIQYIKSKSGELIYVSISKLNILNDGTFTVIFCYSYLRSDLRNKGIGSKAFKDRINFFKNQFPFSPITGTCRLNNLPSIKIFKKCGFKSCYNFKYNNGDDGVKLILC